MKRIFTLLTALVVVFGLSVSARATLIDRGGGLIYDDDLDITWLQDANYAMTSGYDADGLMNWDEAMTWASNLIYGGYDDWRLPTVTDIGNDGCNNGFSGTDCGYNVDTSTGEMAHLSYDELGNLGYYDTMGRYPQPGWNLTNTGPFTNLQPTAYWSGTEYAPYPALFAWGFYFDYGSQRGMLLKDYGYYALAVRSGDVSAPIPEPGTLLLLGSGLVGLAGFRKKFKVRTS